MTTTQPQEATTSFTDLGVAADFADALAEIGIHSPFPIQEITLPLALAGADVIGQARTGTGKTLAFGLPLLQGVKAAKRRRLRRGAQVQALVVVPTRELCLQVRDDLAQTGARRDIEVVAAYGGRSIEPQIEALRGGAPVVVGTPGRLLDLTGRGELDLSGVSALVLDEADEMLDLGFLPDVERIVEQTPPDRQTLLFSATMPAPVVALARRYMRKPTFLRADVEETHVGPETNQYFLSCHRLDKPAVLARILQAPSRGLCVVFVRTKRMADILANDLRDRGISAAPIHSDLRQEARERALARFRQGKVDVLVATEVAARGLDIDDVTHVVNYDCPDDEKMYLHRVGRTGRAGAAGVAITLAVWNELARLEMIKRALEIEQETHEVFSTSEILDDLFDLPQREQDRDVPSRQDWERAVRRGQRDTRRDGGAPGRDRRPRRGERAGDREPAARKPAAREPATSAPEAQPARETREGEGRVRRRVRQRSVPGGEGGDRPRDAREGDVRQGSGSEADEGGRRVRRRTRTTARGEARQLPGGDAGARGEPAGTAKARNDRRTGAPSGRGSARGSGRSRGGSSRDGSARRSGRGGRTAKTAGGQGRDGSGAQVDRDAARGEGRPRLRRPFEVTHLP